MKIALNKDNCIRWLIGILVIVISGTAVYSVEQFTILRSVTLVALLGLLFYTFLKKRSFSNKKMVVFIFFALLFFGLLILKSSGDLFGIVSKLFMAVMFTNYCCCNNNTYKLFEIIYKFVVVCAYSALFIWTLLFVLRVNLPYGFIGDGFYRSYFYIFFTQDGYIENFGGFTFYRLQSIFWEPGVFAVYILIALFYYAFLAKKRNSKNFFVLVVSLILTMSTTGLIVGISLLGVFLIKKLKSRIAKLMMILPISLVSVPMAVYLWNEKKNSAISPSYRLRMYDMTRSIEIWKNNFILGTGYNNTTLFEIEGRYGNSNGFLNWCMTTGLVGLIAVILPFIINCIWSKSKDRIIFIVFLALFVLINFTEPLIQTPIMILLVSFSYAAMLTRRGLSYE